MREVGSWMIETWTMLMQGDCLERMKGIPNEFVDLILCDLPYGTTDCKWDAVIPFEPLWAEYSRVNRGMTVLTASQPFTSKLVTSNLVNFRHAWVWRKTVAANFMLLKFQPSKLHEDVLVFGPTRGTYNAQMEEGEPYTDKVRKRVTGILGGANKTKKAIDNPGHRYPSSIQTFPNPNNGCVHPTQKPLALMEYLIKTYTNSGDTVLDNCMGSGTTGVACVNTGRNFIGIELNPTYFKIAERRIEEAKAKVL
jgi:hypothetical protein